MYYNNYYDSESLYVGAEAEALFRTAPDSYVWGEMYMPIVVTHEYPNFFVCEVLPNRHPHGFGMSQPYRMTIDKFDLDHGLMRVRRPL